jgi:hypothetical protein
MMSRETMGSVLYRRMPPLSGLSGSDAAVANAHAAGSWAYAGSAREAQAQQAALHQVRATLLQAAAPMASGGYGFDANARWNAPDGHVCTGQVFVPGVAAAGSTVMVWTNQADQLTTLRCSTARSRVGSCRPRCSPSPASRSR